MTDATTIRLDVRGEVARMTFDRPEVLNAGNARFAAELGDVVSRSPPGMTCAWWS